MATSFEELKVLQAAEAIADDVWRLIVTWEQFIRDSVGWQLTRATDSIGANIAESFGRFSYGEKLQFLYYARGSLFETKYWLNRVKARKLASDGQVDNYSRILTDLARQLNAFASSLKSQRSSESAQLRTKRVQETGVEYTADNVEDFPELIFSEAEIQWPLSNVPSAY
jgi:four helix bundle protein